MRHATWTAIESSPLALRLFRTYQRLPEPLRLALRWIAMPRWHFAVAYVRFVAQGRVLSGPFAGMKLYLSPISSRKLLGYVLGTQEIELHKVIDRIVARSYATIVNIGAADGYYSIGLACRLPEAKVVAFEANNEHHPWLLRAARDNGVWQRFALAGLCGPAELRDALQTAGPPTLVICDIEGAEKELLDSESVKALSGVDLLVETHDTLTPGCTEVLLTRFARTHEIDCVAGRPRRIGDFPSASLPVIAKLMPRTAVELMNERRKGVQKWLHLRARSSEASGSHGTPVTTEPFSMSIALGPSASQTE